MSYQIRIKSKAAKQLDKLPSLDRSRVLKKLGELQAPFFFQQMEKLQGVEGYRVRVGDYRVLFTIDQKKKVIMVFRLKHRKEVYRF